MRKLMAFTRLSALLLLLFVAFQAQVPTVQSSECTDGQYMTTRVGDICGCEDGVSTPREKYQCINGQWQYMYSFCGAPFCQNPPGGWDCQSQPFSCPYGAPGNPTYCPGWCSCCY